MTRKGQAAMEFLMTYGWAILVVLAAIGALAYFGVLSPDRFLPEKCTANPPFACTEYKVSDGSNVVNLTLQNSVGTGMTFVNVSIRCANTGNWLLNSTPGNPAGSILNGETVSFTWNTAAWDGSATTGACDALTEGGRIKADYAIVYIKEGESTTHTGTGNIQVRAEA